VAGSDATDDLTSGNASAYGRMVGLVDALRLEAGVQFYTALSLLSA
jgi:hypothetical protein